LPFDNHIHLRKLTSSRTYLTTGISTEPAKGHGEKKKLSRAHETASRAHDTASRAPEIKFFSHSHNRALTEKKIISCARDISRAHEIASRAHEINFFPLHVPVNYIFYEGAGPVEVPAAAHSILNFEARSVVDKNVYNT